METVTTQEINQTTTEIRDVLVTVDVQNDFVTGTLAVNEGEQVIIPLNQVAEAVRETGGTVAFTRDWHPATTPHFDIWPEHCVAETEGADFASGLEVLEGDIVLSKGMAQTDGYSGWEGVGEKDETLETIIAPRSAAEKVRVFVGGLATDYCVKATGVDVAEFFADDERVKVYLLRDAVRAVALQEADEANALAQLEAAKVIAITSDEAQAMIEKVLK